MGEWYGEPLWETKGFLRAGRGVTVVAWERGATRQRTDLLDDGRGPASAGRFLYGTRSRARVSTSDEDAVSGNCGCGDACGGNFSQLDDRGNSKVVSGARAKDHECDLVAGAGDVHEGDCGGGPRRQYSRLPRARLENTVCTGSRAGCAVFAWANGYARSRGANARLRIEDGNRCHS